MRGFEPSAICERYLSRLRINDVLRQKLLRRAVADGKADAHDAMAELHLGLSDGGIELDDPAAASIGKRLQLAFGTALTVGREALRFSSNRRLHLRIAPPIKRSAMAPAAWPPSPLAVLAGIVRRFFSLRHHRRIREEHKVVISPIPQSYWQHVGTLRRLALVLLVIAQTALATYFMQAVLPYHGEDRLEVAELVLFALLCAWVSAGFWTALMGYLVLRFSGDRYAISGEAAGTEPIATGARTAIIMPICNEHVPRVFAGLRATYESLARTGELEHFDFYVLSDSSDPDTRVAETEAWVALCQAVEGFGRVFYRWRRHRIKRKSGNVADFCRRWGANYRYMVILDADSVMSGECLASLVRLMERNPNAGIIQTAPHAAGRDTLYARLQQFASRVYGPLFVAGLHFWQLGESHYWGHNAIIRVEPFIKHCALGRLPGRGSLSGEILSHDFVEAALMRRAGWAVWIAYDLPGSYEEMPPNLVDELKRDRRWCHGNLMNFRLFLAPGIHPVHRAVFVTGMISYVSAPLWFAFLILSTWLLAKHTLVEPQYFTQPKQLFPVWPEWHPERALALFGATATWLFLPKLLSVTLIRKAGAKDYGGTIRLGLSMFAEFLFSILLAPIRMLFHTQFVAAALTGWKVHWQSPPREDTSTSWNEALHRHGWHTLLGLVWAGTVYWLNPSFLWWLLPIVGALILSIPISVYSSHAFWGRLGRRAGFFLIPEESRPPEELKQTTQHLMRHPPGHGFFEAVTDPTVNALMCAAATARAGTDLIRKRRQQLVDNALRDGPEALPALQKMALLNDPVALSQLHFYVWTLPMAHPAWLELKN